MRRHLEEIVAHNPISLDLESKHQEVSELMTMQSEPDSA
jgi:hypothetical protein